VGTKFRIEEDSLGKMKVPSKAYWGINVARALNNFPISGRTIHPGIIDAYCHIKKAAAKVNSAAGRLTKKHETAIGKAADEVLSGKLRDQFVVDIFQAGAGTSTNMNVNEVLCNRALEILGEKKGRYDILQPNDHVNMGQSTNDTYPTAMRISALYALEEFYPKVKKLADSLNLVGRKFEKYIKSGRTHLQDAAPVTLGGEFKAYGKAVETSTANIRRASNDLLYLGIGGSAVGTGMNTHPAYSKQMCHELSKQTGFKFKKTGNLMYAMQSQGPIGGTSSAIRDFAVELTRIANDLRLLSSGPTTGLAEIQLPAVQAGSSIMPGKINPSIAEMVNMVCFHVIGNDLTVSQAVAAGQMELNVMMPVMAENLLESIHILGNSCRQLATHCVDGISADRRQCKKYAHRSMGLATALMPAIGYLNSADIAKRALAEGKAVPELVKEEKLLSEKELKKVLDPARMTRPNPDLQKKK